MSYRVWGERNQQPGDVSLASIEQGSQFDSLATAAETLVEMAANGAWPRQYDAFASDDVHTWRLTAERIWTSPTRQWELIGPERS